MKRGLAVAAVAVAAGGAGLAGSAIGQGTGGTVGPGAQGTLDLKLRFDGKKSRGGINPAVPRQRDRPAISDLTAGNVDLLDSSGKVIGRVNNFDVTTYGGASYTKKKYKGGAEFLAFGMLDFGNNNLLFATCRASDDDRSNPCAIIGGTGRFAGARGSWLQDFSKAIKTKTTETVPIQITFIP